LSQSGSAVTPRVSVVVSTHQRAHLLPAMVGALEAQTLDPSEFEVIITNDGSTDDTAAVLDDLQRRSPLTMTVLHADQNRGAAAGRNLAWHTARAPVIAFTDDDCQPQPKWLEAGLAAMDSARVVVGRTTPPPDQERMAAGPFARALWVREAKYFETANVFYRRVDLEASGGFEERFRAGEDTDLALRIVPTGQDVVFAEDAYVLHEVRESDFVAAVRESFRWVDLPLIVGRHPQVRTTLLHRRLFWKRSHPFAMLGVAGILLAVAGRRPWFLVLLAPWIRLRVITQPLTPGRKRRWLVLPGGLALDVVEVAVMVRGSVRHRTVVL
jgi:glycosyltransferase involved in cell wall biosynthesis